MRSAYVAQRLAEIAANPSLRTKIARPVKLAHPRIRRVELPIHGTRKGHIYFIANESWSRVKIGYATDIHQRLSGLQTGSSEKLVLLFSLQTYFEAEKIIHSHFNADRIRGEWFNLTGDMEELWDDFYDYKCTFGTLFGEYFYNLEDVRFILATINMPWAESVDKWDNGENIQCPS